MYHRYFVRLVDNEELQKRLINARIKPLPDNYNPVPVYDDSVLDEVRIRLEALNQESKVAFVDECLENLEYHLDGLRSRLG